MLNSLAIEAALPVAQRLQERQLRLLPGDNTPLSSLIHSVDNSLIGDTLKTEQGGDLVDLLQARSNNDLHRVAKADIIKLASLSITRLHDTVRHTVLPHVKELVPGVQAYINERRVAAVLPYTVIMREIPAVYFNPVLKQLYERYPALSQLDGPRRNLCPVDIDRIKALCKTGMAGFDNELALCLSLNNDEGYAEVQAVLQGRLDVEGIHADHLPGVLVTAQAIYGEPEAGVELTLVEYNDQINRLLARAAHFTRGAHLRYEASVKSGTLYTTEKRTSLTTIAVMGPVYRDLLDKGLSPEALIGNEMSGRRFSQGQLVENKLALEQVYNREMNLRALKAQTEMAGITREALHVVIGADIAARQAGEDAYKCFKNLVSKVHEKCCDNIQQLVCEIVCEVFYPKTDALVFISLMERVGRQMGEDCDPREMALMATIKYISHWQAKQLGLVQA